MPARPSWGPPGRRCAKPSSGTASACQLATPKRAIAAAHQRTGKPATPTLDPVFVALNPGALPARPRSEAELYQWVRREEQYAALGASVVVELYSESHAASQLPGRGLSSDGPTATTGWFDQRTSRADRRH